VKAQVQSIKAMEHVAPMLVDGKRSDVHILDRHGPVGLAMTAPRHCEERSDAAIQPFGGNLLPTSFAGSTASRPQTLDRHGPVGLAMTVPRHCEERSDAAIQPCQTGLLRLNDE
jgi:hypothetical protein